MQSSAHPDINKTAVALQVADRRSERLLFAIIFVIALCFTPVLMLAGAAISFGYMLGALVVIAIVVLVARWPLVGFYVVAGCALFVEQGPFVINNVTINLYVFFWPPGLTGLVERPIGFLIIFIFLVLICQNLARRQKFLEGGKLLLPFIFFLLCVAIGVAYGLSRGGDFKIIVLEVRPFWYLFVSYLLAYNLVTHKKHIRFLLWMVIACAGLKALQGIYIYLIVLHGDLTGQHQILAHEESFFFIGLLLLVMLFSIHYRYRPQFYTALLILPILIVALIANQRRADYVALLVGAAVAWIIVFVVKPYARKRLIIGMLASVVLFTGYIALFSHSGGSFAAPARAIVAVFQPDASDLNSYLSNLYRVIEDYDLKYTVRQSPLIGFGFGREFLQPIALPNLSTGNPDFNGNPYLFIPHNTIYWVWMRLGAIGYLAFWYLIGSIIVRGCLIARQLQDRYLQLVAIFIVAVTLMEIVVAFADYQLYFYRNVIYVGILAGVLVRLPRIEEDAKKK